MRYPVIYVLHRLPHWAEEKISTRDATDRPTSVRLPADGAELALTGGPWHSSRVYVHRLESGFLGS